MKNLLNLFKKPINRAERRAAQFDALRCEKAISQLIEAEVRFKLALKKPELTYKLIYDGLIWYTTPLIHNIKDKNLKFWYINEEYFINKFAPKKNRRIVFIVWLKYIFFKLYGFTQKYVKNKTTTK